jgi:hypothetical protein
MRPGWYLDPTGRFPLRWYDGEQWTPQALDGWQRPVVDPLGPAPHEPQAAAPPVSSAPAIAPPPIPVAPPPTVRLRTATPEPPLEPTPHGVPSPVPPAPPAYPGPPAPSVGPAATPARRPRPSSNGLRPAARYVIIGVAGVLMLLGLFAFAWVQVGDGQQAVTISYVKIAQGISRYGGGRLNWWQRICGQWFAVVLAFGAVAATTVAVAAASRSPGRTPGWSNLLWFVLIALAVASMLGMPSFPADSSAHPGFGSAISILAGYILLAWVCPTTHRSELGPRRAVK